MENNPDVNVLTILRLWEEEHNIPLYDPEPLLTSLAEIIEAETENYMKMDPDPFDERHPSRADPNCHLGQILKVLFRKDNFMNKLVNDYLRDNYWSRSGVLNKDTRKLNIATCRLMLDILPGLETSAVFQVPEMETLILRLFSWAEKSPQPLQSYATGLLAAAMEVQDIATNFREQNMKLVPLKLKELHTLQAQALEERQQNQNQNSRPFAHLNQDINSEESETRKHSKKRGERKHSASPSSPHSESHLNGSLNHSDRFDSPVKRPRLSEQEHIDEFKHKRISNSSPSLNDNYPMSPPSTGVVYKSNSANSTLQTGECSNSSWAEMENYVIGNIPIYPVTLATRQMLILRYLTPMGEYQEFLGLVFEQNALDLILRYTNLRESKDSRLAFEALKYLSALLCHKKFSIEFINREGLYTLLKVPRPSIAATGVSICLYYLSYCEDAMERICQLPEDKISELVKYALWLLECSHDSGRCHATMFFGLSFQFRIILKKFDSQDGLRKLFNVISTLSILSMEDETRLSEDEEGAARQIVRHVCLALKRYLEAHLCIKAEELIRTNSRESESNLHITILPAKLKLSPEDVQERVQTLMRLMSFRTQWKPVDKLNQLGGITLLLQIIAFAYEWNYSGRAETVRSALDVLAICCVMPQVQTILCERIDLPDEAITFGINIILGAAEGEIVADAEVQKSALMVIINCLCAPIQRVGGAPSSSKRKGNIKSSEEIITKMWESTRSNNGIMVLLQLMMVKTPITDADAIRALACRALAGLARSETVRQIISKLPLFTNGQLQLLTRDPILQDKRQEHVMFQKYALELLERVSGKGKPAGGEFGISLANMHRASVVAQTRIHFNDNQLYQLIHQHLISRGLSDSASALQREANLPITDNKERENKGPVQVSPYVYRASPISLKSPWLQNKQNAPTYAKPLLSPVGTQKMSPMPSTLSIGPPQSFNTPIKLNLNSRRTIISHSTPGCNRTMQKLISGDSSLISTPKIVTPGTTSSSEKRVSLDSIITEYLTNQHALCKNPMVPCPEFNLLEPHRCPDPRAKNLPPQNILMRLTRRSSGLHSPQDLQRLNRRYVHSRFCPLKTFRLNEEDFYFSSCEFTPCDTFLLVGSFQGEVKMYNLSAGTEISTYQCHESCVYHMQSSNDGQLLLTSSSWRRPISALWSIKYFDIKYSLSEEEYVEFSKINQNKIIGTKGEVATIYDVATGEKVLTLTPQISNQYTKNRATFSPSDEIVLSDGVLFDVNSGKEIHKLDKLNQTLSGVFHPSGLEIISNAEVWDLRTFHLMRTVPALEQRQVLFNRAGDTIYTIGIEPEMEEEAQLDSSFNTLDAFDYTSIATIDVRKDIHDLKCNQADTQIAIVENQGMYESVMESTVRLYDVGRRRDDEDEGDEDDDDDDLGGSEDGSGSPSGSDDESPNSRRRNRNQNNENHLDFNLNGESNSDDDDDDFTLSGDDRINSSDSAGTNDEFEIFL